MLTLQRTVPTRHHTRTDMFRNKKFKPRKSGKMDSLRKRTPDYTDFAYKEAVAKLRYLLAESYNPISPSSKFNLSHLHHLHRHQHDHVHRHDGDTHGLDRHSPSLPPKRPTPPFSPQQQPPPEVVNYIDRQEEYIEQLEKESLYYREELTNLMGKVKEVISENEGLQNDKFIKSSPAIIRSTYDIRGTRDNDDVTDDDRQDTERNMSGSSKPLQLVGPSIVFESRISELEAQLTQTKMDLRKSQEECDSLRKQLAEMRVYPASGISDNLTMEPDTQRQIEILQREKNELIEVVDRLQSTVAQIRDKEANATQKVKRSLDVVDQAQFEKNQAELEVRRLKGEVDRLNEKLRECAVEQSRRLAEVERRYSTQTEQLTSDLATQWDNNTKLSLELDRQRRLETDLRRELTQKNATIDELKKELNSKITYRVKVGTVCKGSLQSEMVQSGVEREGLEAELASTRLALERAERNARQETARLQAEVQSLRQRLDRADADLLHSRKENLRLTEQIASLEKEVDMAKIMGEEHNVSGKREKELTSMILDMDAKHVKSVAELEGMIQSQTQLMEKLKDECHSLTVKLDECSARHKEEMAGLQNNIDYLNNKLEA
ncbi:serologically defined colon cancer antigen 8 homolog, partial [Lycorma delicatula]|uniref:serologically defined colon cancer antigen 8 homolog n=1 Tax=Lycorma delicatula TaxID=130591 RepID=UPI003F514D54